MTFSNRLHEIALKELGSSIERPTQDRVIDKLDMLAEIRAALEINRADYETKRAEILKTVQAELDALEEEYAPLLQEPQEVISNLETEIKNDVLLNGATIKGSKYKAVYMHGRITWDTKGITKYAEVNPEILNFKKQGQPSVSIRAIHHSNLSKDNNSILKKFQDTESKKINSFEEVRQEFPRTHEQ